MKASLAVDDCAEQFLQVARALDPTRAQAPSDTDTNDLSTINVYTVGIFIPTLSLILHLMRLLRDHRMNRAGSEVAQVLAQIPLTRCAWLR